MARATKETVVNGSFTDLSGRGRTDIEPANRTVQSGLATVEDIKPNAETGQQMLTISQWYALQAAEKERESAIKAARATKAAAKPAKRLRQATAQDIAAHKAFYQYQAATARFLRFNADPTIINGTRAVRHTAIGFIVLTPDTLDGWLVEVGQI